MTGPIEYLNNSREDTQYDRQADVRESKESIRVLTENLDDLLAERETVAMMKLSKRSLSAFLDEEPDLYTAGDAGVVYRRTGY